MRRVPGLVSRVPGLVSRVPGLLEPCLPSLCFFLWSIRVSGLHQGSGILGLLFPFIVFLLVRDLFPGFRDFWNFVSHHCFCFVVHQGAGLHQGSGILGLLSPIIVFFLVVYQGSGIFGTLSPIIVFVLWSIRARDFIRVLGFLDFCFPSLCFFWFRDLSPEFQDLSPGFRDFLELLSPIIVFFLVVYQGSGIFGNLSPIIVFVLWSIRARDFIRVPGFLDFCLPSLCFFLWFIRAPGFLEPCLPSLCLFCGPSGRGTSSGFRDSWTFVSHHCVSSGSGTCLPSIRTCLPGSGTFGTLSPIIVFFLVVYQGSGIFGNLSPIIVFVLWSIRARDFIRVPGFLDFCFPSLCFFWFRDLSPEFRTCLPGSGTFGTLSPIIVFFLVVYQGSGIFGNLSPITAEPVGFQSLGLGLGPGDLQPSSLCFFLWFKGSGIFGNSQQQSLLGFNL